MRYRVRVMAALLSVLCLLTGCGVLSPQEGQQKPVTLTALQYELENMAVDFNGLWFYQRMEEQTGVHVDFKDVKDSEWVSSVAQAFVRGNMPDLILRGSLDVEEYGVSRHLLLPLDEYISKGFLPHYAQRLQASGLQDQLTASDGHMYQLGFLISQGVNTNGHFFINRDWLEALRLPVPQTVDELTETLRHFRLDDPNGNGRQDEVPLECTFDDNNTGVYNLFSFFGLPLNEEYVYVDEQGSVAFAPESPAFVECAAWLNRMYQEGLLDVDFISQGSNIWAAKVNEGNVGMFSYWRLQNTALSPEVTAQYQVMLPVHSGGTGACLPRNMDMIEFGAALTAECRDPEAALRWLDAQFETENMLVSQNGAVGDTLIRRDDGRYEVLYVPEGNDLYHTVPVICGQFFAPADYYAGVYVPAAHRQEKAEYCRLYEEGGVLESVSSKYLTAVAPKTPLENAQLARLKARLKSIIDAALVQMVTQGVTAENTALLQRQLQEAGSGEYREIYQTLYDRWRGV
ncbi:MAG: extracellular solute-binding protein [Clostridia bacterium]|nr:extracellular solute-binding protein [Clostridia bacterium]